MAIGHTHVALKLVHPGLGALGATPAAWSSEVSFSRANGYFITSGIFHSLTFTFPTYKSPDHMKLTCKTPPALLCLKWSNSGIQDGLDKYIFVALMLTHFYTRVTYFVKGMLAPPLTYWSTNLSMGIAFLGVDKGWGIAMLGC